MKLQISNNKSQINSKFQFRKLVIVCLLVLGFWNFKTVFAQDIPLAPGEVLNSNFPRREDIPNNASPVGGFDPYASPSNPNYVTGNNQQPVCGPQGDSYVLCVPLLGVTQIPSNSLSYYVSLIYKLALGIGGLLVFIMVVWGGIEYVVSFGSVAKATAARQRIFDAVIGLALLFGSYIILNTINPDLVKLKEPGASNFAIINQPNEETHPFSSTAFERERIETVQNDLNSIRQELESPDLSSERKKELENQEAIKVQQGLLELKTSLYRRLVDDNLEISRTKFLDIPGRFALRDDITAIKGQISIIDKQLGSFKK